MHITFIECLSVVLKKFKLCSLKQILNVFSKRHFGNICRRKLVSCYVFFYKTTKYKLQLHSKNTNISVKWQYWGLTMTLSDQKTKRKNELLITTGLLISYISQTLDVQRSDFKSETSFKFLIPNYTGHLLDFLL